MQLKYSNYVAFSHFHGKAVNNSSFIFKISVIFFYKKKPDCSDFCTIIFYFPYLFTFSPARSPASIRLDH